MLSNSKVPSLQEGHFLLLPRQMLSNIKWEITFINDVLSIWLNFAQDKKR